MEELLETLYSGIVNVRDWDLFCKKLSEILIADSVILLSVNRQTNKPQYAASYGVSKEIQQILLKFLTYDDPRINLSKSDPTQPHIFGANTPIDNNKLFSSSSIYKEAFVPDFIEHHLVQCFTIDQFEELYIIICRKSGKGSFKQDDIDVLNELKSHIIRAVKVQKKHASNDKYIRAGLNTLKHQPVGSIIANSESHVFHLNEYAKSIIDQKDGLLIINDRIYHGINKKITLLSDVIDLTLKSDQEHSTSLAREHSTKPYQLCVKPFNARRSPFQSQHSSENMVHIFVIDPDRPTIMTATLLENVFGLTVSEARVASSLAQNCNLKTTQDELNISANTARTHLKKIFTKMNVTSQVELVKLITTSYLWSSD